MYSFSQLNKDSDNVILHSCDGHAASASYLRLDGRCPSLLFLYASTRCWRNPRTRPTQNGRSRACKRSRSSRRLQRMIGHGRRGRERENHPVYLVQPTSGPWCTCSIFPWICCLMAAADSVGPVGFFPPLTPSFYPSRAVLLPRKFRLSFQTPWGFPPCLCGPRARRV